MKTKILPLFLFFLPFCSTAQNRNANWCFGDSAGINFSNLSSPVPITSSINARGSSVSISDSTGNLLFYSSTFYMYLYLQAIHQLTVIYNSTGQVMDNGDTIVGEGWYQELAIIPFPNSSNLYYLFSTGSGVAQIGLYYSIVDLSQNGGLGKVIAKNIQMTGMYPFEGITAIKHGNGRDWWLVLKLSGINNGNNNVFYNYLISPFGISPPIIDSVGVDIISDAGQLRFSKDGNKLAICTWNNLLEIFDFDRCAGRFTNPIIIEPENHAVPGEMRSVAFSPEGTRLYLLTDCIGGCTGGIGYLIQYDLLAGNIQASKNTIYTFVFPEQPFHIRLAPDDKIYLSTDYGNYTDYPDSVRNYVNESLSVINQPDSLGMACDFQPFSFYLGGKRTYNALPNNPDYEMGPLIGSGCDSLPVGLTPSPSPEERGVLHVFYHGGWQVAFINAEGLQGKNYALSVYDLMGHEVYKQEGLLVPPSGGRGYYTKDLNCASFASGMYIVKLQTEKEMLSKKFVKE